MRGSPGGVDTTERGFLDANLISGVGVVRNSTPVVLSRVARDFSLIFISVSQGLCLSVLRSMVQLAEAGNIVIFSGTISRGRRVASIFGCFGNGSRFRACLTPVNGNRFITLGG